MKPVKNVGLRVFVIRTKKKLYKKQKKVLTKTCKHGILLLVREGKRKTQRTHRRKE